MATTPGGLVYPVTTDAFDPSGDLARLAASADAGRIVTVPNTTARDALAALMSPTPARPLYVHRQDAGTGRELERSIDGTAWTTLAASTPVAPAAFFTPVTGITIQADATNVEVVGRTVVWQLRLNRTGGFSLAAGQQVTDLGAVALPYRPRGYFASWSGWGGSPVLQGLCGQGDGALTIRWASGSGSPTHLVLGGAWPIA